MKKIQWFDVKTDNEEITGSNAYVEIRQMRFNLKVRRDPMNEKHQPVWISTVLDFDRLIDSKTATGSIKNAKRVASSMLKNELIEIYREIYNYI
jgi:hypothetical protein